MLSYYRQCDMSRGVSDGDTILCGMRLCIDATLPPDVAVLKNTATGQVHVIYNLAVPTDNTQKASDV